MQTKPDVLVTSGFEDGEGQRGEGFNTPYGIKLWIRMETVWGVREGQSKLMQPSVGVGGPGYITVGLE